MAVTRGEDCIFQLFNPEMAWLLIVKERSWRSTNPSWKAEPMDETSPIAIMKIVTLGTLPKPILWSVWDKYFPRRPPRSRRYLEAQLAYLLQKQAYDEMIAAMPQKRIKAGVKANPLKRQSKTN